MTSFIVTITPLQDMQIPAQHKFSSLILHQFPELIINIERYKFVEIIH